MEDGQNKTLAFFLLFLLLVILPQPIDATFPKESPKDELKQDDEKKEHKTETAETESKPAFPNQLDISTLRNMPMVILHPRTPINFQMLPGEDLASIHKSLNPSKILELLQSATFNIPIKIPPPGDHEERQARNRKFVNYKAQASGNRPQSIHAHDHSNTPALPRSLMNNQNNGWFQRFRGSFSNMFPSIKPMRESPFNFGLPTMNMPVFLPHQNSMHSNINPFMMGSHQQPHFLPWKNFHYPSMIHHGDLTTDASFIHPTRMFFGNSHLNHFRPAPQFGGLASHFGGDLATSGSSFMPHRVLPPFGHPVLPPRFVPPVQRHKPLFSKIGGLQAASMDISNAFADFTDSKEHGPEVTQRFGSVGHSITNFLKMMGLGADGGMGFGDVGGFGGGSDMAAMDSTPIARSMDFYPGYGNQAHLDDIDDFPIFNEDITKEFMKKMNLTNATSIDDKEYETEMPLKEVTLPPKIKLELIEKIKIPIGKGSKDPKQANMKVIVGNVNNMSYVPAVPLEKLKDNAQKSKSKPTEEPDLHTKRPVVSYKVPSTYSTVDPRDRKPPIAIYQHFNSDNKDAPKPPEYAPAQAMPQQEGEDNPNKLVDEDEVREWKLVSTGQGYAEKRPVPIVDVLQASMHPESLKVLQKVLSGEAVKATV